MIVIKNISLLYKECGNSAKLELKTNISFNNQTFVGMNVVKIKLSFSRLTDSEMLINARHYAQQTTASGYFAGATALVTAVTTGATAFEAAIQNAKKGGEGTTAVKNSRRFELESSVRILGSYVEDNCGGDANKVLAAGFALRNSTQNSAKPLTLPANFLAKQLGNGAMSLKFEGGEHRAISELQYRAIGTTDWSSSVYFTEHTLTINGLSPGTQYEFRLRCIGKSKNAAPSPATAYLPVVAWAI